MITLRKSLDRGHADHGWLKSFHSFSFADYRDPRHMGYGNLRVINEDHIAPGTGFGTHGHRDMEIVTYVLQGALGHKDSLGHAARIVPGEVQRMSAGRGIEHSEFNLADNAATHLFQIWILPDQAGIEPGYEQKRFDATEKRGRLRLIASRDGRDGSVRIHADAGLYAGLFDETETAEQALDPRRKTYVQLLKGRLHVNGHLLEAGDALALEGEDRLTLSKGEGAEVLVFDLTA